MAEPKETSAQAQEGSSPPPKGKGKMMIIVIACLFLLLGAGAIFFFAPSLLPGSIRPSSASHSAQALSSPTVEKQGHLYSLEPFLVNLLDQDMPRYLRTRIELESSEPKANEEFEKRLPQLRDAILTTLANRKFQEILDSEGKNRLKEEIRNKLNGHLQSFQIKKVYFTEFVAQ